MRRSRWFGLAGLVLLLMAGLVAAGSTGALSAAARWVGVPTGSSSVSGAPTPISSVTASEPSPSSGPSAQTEPPDPVLRPAAGSRTESAARLARRLAAVPPTGVGGSYGASVVDLRSGKQLYGHRATTGLTPASTQKLLTSTAALQRLGPQHRFSTTVVLGEKRGTSRQIVLVGGGDPYLATRDDPDRYPHTASLESLAADTAKALKHRHRSQVSLGYDASLFSGPAWSPHWPATYGDQVTPVSALVVDEGRVLGYSPGPRVDDPARDAADTFARLLRKQGVTVTTVDQATAAPKATRIAAVESMPVAQIVEQLLLHSDNDAAEMMLRQVGLASHHTGSFVGGVAAVRSTLRSLGVWRAGTTIYDGSGLSRDNRVPAAQLTAVLVEAAATDQPQLRAVLTGLPTAAVDGSLRYRYGDQAGAAGRGVLRAKTGTLTGVHSLAGYVLTRDGVLLGFAYVTNDVTNEYASTVWLEHVTAAIARCGCR